MACYKSQRKDHTAGDSAKLNDPFISNRIIQNT